MVWRVGAHRQNPLNTRIDGNHPIRQIRGERRSVNRSVGRSASNHPKPSINLPWPPSHHHPIPSPDQNQNTHIAQPQSCTRKKKKDKNSPAQEKSARVISHNHQSPIFHQNIDIDPGSPRAQKGEHNVPNTHTHMSCAACTQLGGGGVITKPRVEIKQQQIRRDSPETPKRQGFRGFPNGGCDKFGGDKHDDVEVKMLVFL